MTRTAHQQWDDGITAVRECLLGEGASLGWDGMAGIAFVICERVRDKRQRWPNRFEDVVKQRSGGYWTFNCFGNAELMADLRRLDLDSQVYRDADLLARVAVNWRLPPEVTHRMTSPAGNANHYLTRPLWEQVIADPMKRPGIAWMGELRRIRAIDPRPDGHVFLHD